MAFWRQYYHLIWATQGRQPLIAEEIEQHLYRYIVSKAAELGVYIYAIDGLTDHIHLVVAIPPRHGTAHIVKHIKGASAYYINHSVNPEYRFAWQRGYASLTLGERQRPAAEAYVRKQKKHHAEQTTNIWLEYATALDEGPAEPDANQTARVGFVREDAPPYDAWGPLPF